MVNASGLEFDWSVYNSNVLISISLLYSTWDGVANGGIVVFDNSIPNVKQEVNSSELAAINRANSLWHNLIPYDSNPESENSSHVVIYKASPSNITAATQETDLTGAQLTGYYLEKAEIVFTANYDLSGASVVAYRSLVHEFGHFYGLTHPEGDALNPNYTQLQTIMTDRIFTVNASTLWAITPMGLDVAAMHEHYGVGSWNDDETIYDTNSLITTGYSFTGGLRAQTIWDSGGDDTFDLSNFNLDMTINLKPAVDVDGNWHDNRTTIGQEYVYIARGSHIENAIGGGGNDTIYGSDPFEATVIGAASYEASTGNNRLEGGAGNDVIYGGGGADKLYGDAGIDILVGDDSGDTVGSADELHGGSERDYLYGGAGNDELSGDDGDDLLYGESGDDQLYGGSGNDVLYDGLGNDSLYGGSGSDDYRIRLSTDSGAGVQHNLIRDLDSDGKLWISDATGNVYSTLSGVAQYNVANDCWTWGGYSLVLRGNDLVIKLDSAAIFVHGNDNVAMNFAAA